MRSGLLSALLNAIAAGLVFSFQPWAYRTFDLFMYPINRLLLAVFGGTQELGLPGLAFGAIVNIFVDWIVFYLALLLFQRRKTRISPRVRQLR